MPTEMPPQTNPAAPYESPSGERLPPPFLPVASVFVLANASSVQIQPHLQIAPSRLPQSTAPNHLAKMDRQFAWSSRSLAGVPNLRQATDRAPPQVNRCPSAPTPVPPR